MSQKNQYRVTPRAFEDLVSIGRYTETNWGKKQRNTYLQAIEHAPLACRRRFILITHPARDGFPGTAQHCPTLPWARLSSRAFPVWEGGLCPCAETHRCAPNEIHLASSQTRRTTP